MNAYHILYANQLRNVCREIHSRTGRDIRTKYAKQWIACIEEVADALEKGEGPAIGEGGGDGRITPDDPDTSDRDSGGPCLTGLAI